MLSINESWAFEAVIEIEDNDVTKENKKDTILNRILDEIYDKEASSA